MEPGKIVVITGLVSSILAIALYAAHAISGERFRPLLISARIVFGATVCCAIGAFGRLMFLVSHHQFQYDYVMRYSSSDLNWPWNYAATWAGQEGSFLLWG